MKFSNRGVMHVVNDSILFDNSGLIIAYKSISIVEEVIKIEHVTKRWMAWIVFSVRLRNDVFKENLYKTSILAIQ